MRTRLVHINSLNVPLTNVPLNFNVSSKVVQSDSQWKGSAGTLREQRVGQSRLHRLRKVVSSFMSGCRVTLNP